MKQSTGPGACGSVQTLGTSPNKRLWHLYGPQVVEGLGMEKYWMLRVGEAVFKVFALVT